MDHTDDWIHHLSSPRRNHFYFGKMMGVPQFELEQGYQMGQRRLINRLTIGSGILCGLGVSRSGSKLLVHSGVAVDPFGREIVVPRDVQFDPFAATADFGCGDSSEPLKKGRYYVCLAYRECETDSLPVPVIPDCGGVPACENDTTVEAYVLSLVRAEVAPADSGFDCGGWLNPKPGVEPPVGKIPGGRPKQGVEKPEATTAAVPGVLVVTAPTESLPGLSVEGPREPSLNELREAYRERLGEVISSACPPALDGDCVVLGMVDVDKPKGAESLEIIRLHTTGRRQIYRQEQLLEMILCLAARLNQCCEEAQEEPTPVPHETLRVTNVELIKAPDEATKEWTVVAPVPQTRLPTYEVLGVRPHNNVLARSFLYLRVTFGQPVDAGGGLPRSPNEGFASSRVLRLTRRDLKTKKETPLDVMANYLSANQLLLLSSNPHGGAELTTPGIYRLTVFGSVATGDDGHDPVRSWASTADQRELLDGEPGAFPSGDGTPGGDFTYTFELRAPSE
jgi:hypothetical protein